MRSDQPSGNYTFSVPEGASTDMPLSNCEVGAGTAPIPALLEAGVKVGLGLDGYITDFFEAMPGRVSDP